MVDVFFYASMRPNGRVDALFSICKTKRRQIAIVVDKTVKRARICKLIQRQHTTKLNMLIGCPKSYCYNYCIGRQSIRFFFCRDLF